MMKTTPMTTNAGVSAFGLVALGSSTAETTAQTRNFDEQFAPDRHAPPYAEAAVAMPPEANNACRAGRRWWRKTALEITKIQATTSATQPH